MLVKDVNLVNILVHVYTKSLELVNGSNSAYLQIYLQIPSPGPPENPDLGIYCYFLQKTRKQDNVFQIDATRSGTDIRLQ